MTRRVKRDRSRSVFKLLIGTSLFAFVIVALASLSDSCYWGARLSNIARDRSLARTTIDGNAIVSRSASDERLLTRQELRDALVLRAEGSLEVNARDVVERGLARLEDSEKKNALVLRLIDDAEASRYAASALKETTSSNLNEDADLAAALDFLSDLEDAPDAESTLWSFEVERGDPLASVGLVDEDDFENAAISFVVQRACATTTRAFFWSVAFGTLIAPLRSLLRIIQTTFRLRCKAVARRHFFARSSFVASTIPILLLASVRLLD